MSFNATSPPVEGATSIGMSVVLTATSVITIVTNLIVIILTLSIKQIRRKAHNVVVLSLSFSDLFIGISLSITSIPYLPVSAVREYHFCMFRYTLFFVVESSSLLQVIFICVERLVAIRFNKKLAPMSKQIPCIIIGVWASSILVGNLPAFLWGAGPVDYASSCTLNNAYSKNFNAYLLYMSGYFLSLFSVIILCHCYILIFLALQSRRHRIVFCSDRLYVNQTGKSYEENTRNFTQSMVTVGAIVIALVVCGFPFMLAFFLDGLSENISLSKLSKNVLLYIWCLNSALNPIIYAWKIKEFRKALFCRLNSVNDVRSNTREQGNRKWFIYWEHLSAFKQFGHMPK